MHRASALVYLMFNVYAMDSFVVCLVERCVLYCSPIAIANDQLGRYFLYTVRKLSLQKLCAKTASDGVISKRKGVRFENLMFAVHNIPC